MSAALSFVWVLFECSSLQQAGTRVKAWRHLHRDFCFQHALTTTTKRKSQISASIVLIVAMETGASSAPVGHDTAPLNFIYACSICCATFADTYEGHNDTVQGLSDGINPKDRLVTKLYLASCCHVLCNEHFEGGGECSLLAVACS